MLRDSFDLHHGQYQLVKHFPEQFFIIFADSRTKQWALDRRSVSYRGRVFHFGDWSEECYARKTCFEFRVKVRVEGFQFTVGEKMWLLGLWAGAALFTMSRSALGAGNALGPSIFGLGAQILVISPRRSV